MVRQALCLLTRTPTHAWDIAIWGRDPTPWPYIQQYVLLSNINVPPSGLT